MEIERLKEIASRRRADAVTMINRANTGHTGGAMSCLDILTCLYYDVMHIDPHHPEAEDRDRFLLSKGHSVEGLWAILADLGYFPKTMLRDFSAAGSALIGHPNNKVPGVEFCTGALGHGLPIAVGIALGAKRCGKTFNTYVLMGDGEQAEGSVWEAAMAGANYHLDNLYAILDRNKLQISGSTEDVMALENLADKWRAFGWDVTEADGNDMQQLHTYFHTALPAGKPHMLIAHTIKGKGLPYAENLAPWHHKVPNDAQVAEAYQALGVEGVDWL